MTTVAGDSKGDWIFIGEGGTIAFVDMRGITVASDPSVHNPFNTASKVKRVRTGSLAIRASALLLDPDADLNQDTDMPQDGLVSNDREDVLYIAAGRFGLWAMRAETSDNSTAWNSVVRIDDSPNDNPLNQTSSRFCNQLEIASVEGQQYLVATFGEKDGGSKLRFYDIDQVRDRLDWDIGSHPPQLNPTSGTGYELARTWEVSLGQRPNFPIPYPTTYSEAFPLGIAVDHPPTSPSTCSAVYVAMGTHGVIRATPTVAPGMVSWATAWGPAFGDGTPYAMNGANGQLYTNLEYRTMSRSAAFDRKDRSEPPIFTDVAVQHEPIGEGASVMHYLYCTVDYLNWVRFDLGDPWSNAMPIDHHEGEPIAIESKPYWFGDQGVERFSSYGTWKEMVRATDLPPFDNHPLGTNRMDTTFARRVELVDPPPQSAYKNKLVVVTASGLPFFHSSLVTTPRGAYNHTFQNLAGVNFDCAIHLAGGSAIATTIVYDSTELSGFRSEIGYITSGGDALFVPPDQSTTGDPDTLKLIHNARVDGDPVVLHGQGSDGLNETCLSFYDLVNAPTGVGPPTFVRGTVSEDNRGRYNNGIGYCISDPRILTSSHNDGLPEMDGILWTRPQGNTVVIGPAAPQLPGDDRRMETGVVCPQNNQWQTPDTNPNDDFVYHYIAGQGKAGLAGFPLLTDVGWSIARHTVEVLAATFGADVTFDWLRVYNPPTSRWMHITRGGYTSASTTDEVFKAWATARAQGEDPVDYIFFARSGTADGLFVVDRTRFMLDQFSPPPPVGSRVRIDWPDDQALPAQFNLNTHPEWDPIPGAMTTDDPSSLWWRTFPVIEHQGTSVAWTPVVQFHPEAVSSQDPPTDEWILAVPCFTLSNPHSQQQPLNNIAGTVGAHNLDLLFTDTWFQNVDAETAFLMSKFGRGLVQFWRLTDLPRDQAHFNMTGQPPGTSNLPFIVLPHDNTCAWKLESTLVEMGADSQVLLFVADFGGHLYVYDVTHVPDLPRATQGLGATHLLATWQAPLGVLDTLPSNVRALAIDNVNQNLVRAYVGVPGLGIEILDLERVGSTGQWGFNPQITHIETPGDPYGLVIRPHDSASGAQKALLVSDSFAGLRVYGEEIP